MCVVFSQSKKLRTVVSSHCPAFCWKSSSPACPEATSTDPDSDVTGHSAHLETCHVNVSIFTNECTHTEEFPTLMYTQSYVHHKDTHIHFYCIAHCLMTLSWDMYSRYYGCSIHCGGGVTETVSSQWAASQVNANCITKLTDSDSISTQCINIQGQV